MASIRTILGVSVGCLIYLSRPGLRGREGWWRQRHEEIELGRRAHRSRQTEVVERGARQYAASRGALDEALLQQVRLDDVLDDVALVAERRRDCLETDRAARVVLGDATQVAPVHAVETTRVDIEPLQRRIGIGAVDARHAFDRGKVADTAQQAYRDARGAPRPPRNFGGAVGAQLDAEKRGGAADDACELRRLVEC